MNRTTRYRGPALNLNGKRWLIDYLFNHALGAAADHIRGRVLDIGCGGQRYRRFIKSDTYIGLDLRPTGDVIADACSLPFATSSIDTVLCFQMLDDIAEPLKLFREIHRVLKDSGRLLLSVDLSWRVHDAPHDYFRFTCYGLAYLASQASLKIDKIQPLGGVWALIASRIAFRVCENRLGLYRLGRYLLPLINWGVLIGGLVLDKLDFRPEDTASYFMIATKWPDGCGPVPEPKIDRAFSI